jgi:hypothetical protein
VAGHAGLQPQLHGDSNISTVSRGMAWGVNSRLLCCCQQDCHKHQQSQCSHGMCVYVRLLFATCRHWEHLLLTPLLMPRASWLQHCTAGGAAAVEESAVPGEGYRHMRSLTLEV